MFNIDFTKFGDSIGEALEKAKNDLERGVDDALGIAGQASGTEGTSDTLSCKPPPAPPSPAVEATKSTSSQEAPASGVMGDATTPDASAPPAAAAAKKKIIKKVVKRVVKKPAEGDHGAQPPQPPGSASSAADAATTPQMLSQATSHAADSPAPGSPRTSHVGDSAHADMHPAAGPKHPELRESMPDAAGDSGMANGSSGRSSNFPQAGLDATPAATASTDESSQSPKANGDEAGHESVATAGSGAARGGGSESPGNGQPQESSTATPAASPASVSTVSISERTIPVLPALLPSEDIPGLKEMDREALLAMVMQLRDGLSTREQQLIRQAEQASKQQQTLVALQDKNEELALKTAKVSEQDFEEIRHEFEQRLGTAERKVYALTKERDALKKGTEKLTDYGNLIREKDAHIVQVMEEGERLASKQADMEGQMKKLRQQMNALEAEKKKLQTNLTTEQSESETLRKARAKMERDLAAAHEHSKAELESQKHHMDQMLTKAKADQLDAEERGREVASQGLARKLRESESRCEALTESVVEFREALDRQRQAADLREEMLKQDISDLERRCHATELRHQELTSKLPEATRPLLRQIEAMQAASEAQGEAWEGAERTLTNRINEAESRAASAVERERLTTERTQTLHNKVSALEAALQAARGEARRLGDELMECERRLDAQEESRRMGQQQIEGLVEKNRILQLQAEHAAQTSAEALAVERDARQAAEADALHVQKQCEERIADIEAEIHSLRSTGGYRSQSFKQGSTDGGGVGDPPAMAAPGYHWVLVRDGELHQQQTQPHRGATSTTGQDGAGEAMSSGKAAARAEASSETVDTVGGLKVSELSQSNGALASEAEDLRQALRISHGEMSSMEGRIHELQASRDRLAEELVMMAQRSEQAQDVIYEMENLKSEVVDTRGRYIAAVELLGERDESLEELRADLMEVKLMYKDQIEFMCVQLAQLQAARYPNGVPPSDSRMPQPDSPGDQIHA